MLCCHIILDAIETLPCWNVTDSSSLNILFTMIFFSEPNDSMFCYSADITLIMSLLKYNYDQGIDLFHNVELFVLLLIEQRGAISSGK